MMSEDDPTHLADPGGPGPARLRELLEASRADVGTPEEIAKLATSLAPFLGPPGGVPGPAAPALVGKATASMITKVVVGALVVAGGSAVFVTTRSAAPFRATRPSATARVIEPVPAAVPPPAPVLAPPVEDAVPAVPPASARSAPHASGAASPVGGPEGSSEADLLGQAQAALGSDPARALALVEIHRRRFPAGVLGQEREVIAIEALSRLGRQQQAKARAERFLRAFPGSAHRSKIESVLGTK